jgi:hypothetical protein
MVGKVEFAVYWWCFCEGERVCLIHRLQRYVENRQHLIRMLKERKWEYVPVPVPAELEDTQPTPRNPITPQPIVVGH